MRKSVPWYFILTALLASILQASPGHAQTITWVSGTGSDTNASTFCQRAAPCQSFAAALSVVAAGGTVFCADPVLSFGRGSPDSAVVITKDVTIDCTTGFGASPIFVSGGVGIAIGTPSINVTLRGLTIYGVDAPNGAQTAGVSITAGAVVRIENCKIFGVKSGPGVQITPGGGTATIKIQDSTITNNGSGIGVTPTGGANVLMSVDRSRIESNNGGGVRIDAIGGPINLSISDSSVAFNAGNGLNAISNSNGEESILVLTRDIVSFNGAAGVQANGPNSVALLDTTLLESNAGALSSVAGGNLLTDGNNRIAGGSGSGFTGSAPPPQ